jgi:protein-tyrosine phosphatase
MRDSLAEVNVQDRIREACILLDDADLHSKPTYVHCKAGKSRSVTIVLAYLIHR